MFTPVGEKSRVTRTTRRSKLGNVEPNVPSLSGPPSYSYGSPATALSSPIVEAKTPSLIASVFNNAILMSGKNNKLDHSIRRTNEEDTDSESNVHAIKTPRRRTPTLTEIEASVNRRRSLRSASRSIGAPSTYTHSRSEASNTDDDDDVSLDYDVTQSSPQRQNDEDIRSSQLSRLQKTSQFEKTGRVRVNDTSSGPSRASELYSRIVDQLDFLYFVLRRSSRWPFVAAKRCVKYIWSTIRSNSYSLLRGFMLVFIPLGLLLILFHPISSWRSSDGQHVSYNVPVSNPQNLEEVITRLRTLEQSLADQWMTTTKVQERTSKAHVAALEQVRSTFSDVEAKMKDVTAKVENIVPQLSDLKTYRLETDNTLRKHDRDIEQISGNGSALQFPNFQNTNDEDKKELYRLKDTMSTSLKDINDLQDQIADLFTAENLTDKIIQELKSLEADNLHTQAGVANKSAVPQQTPHMVSNFKNFIRQIVGLRKTVDQSDSQKDDLHNMIEREIAVYLEREAEKGRGMPQDKQAGLSQNELVKLLDDLETRLQSRISRSEEEGAIRDGTSPHQNGRIDHSRLEATMEAMVERAIHEHSLDVLARPDYASYSSGARINPFLTSATFLHRPSALIPRMLSRIFYDIGTVKSHAPAIAIHPSNAVGMCWSFPGHTGQLSVKLSAPIWLSDIAIEHVHPDIAHDVTSAPKEIEIWAQVADYAAHETKLADHLEQSEGSARQAPDPSFVHVMDIEYNVYSKLRNVQIFAVPQTYKDLKAPVKQIVYRFRSNWGNAEYTCIYRVRALGLGGTLRDQDIAMDEDV